MQADPARTADLEELVLNEILEHLEKNIRKLSLQINVNPSIIWRILHEQQLHPHHFQQVHTLLPYDHAPHAGIWRWFLKTC